jgi:hypothetical protein
MKETKSERVEARVDRYMKADLAKVTAELDRSEGWYIRVAIQEKLERDGYGSLHVFPGVVYDDTNVCKPDPRTGTFAD